MSMFNWLLGHDEPEVIEELVEESEELTPEQYQALWGTIDQRLAADARYIEQKLAERREQWKETHR